MNNFKQYIKNAKPANMWELIWLIVQSKEFKYILGAIIIILIYNPDWIVKLKSWLVDVIHG